MTGINRVLAMILAGSLSACSSMEGPGPLRPEVEVPDRVEPAAAAVQPEAVAVQPAAAIVQAPEPAPAVRQEAVSAPATEIAPADPPPARAAEAQDHIFFAAGHTKVDESGMATLRRHADRLKENPNLVVTLIGYADPTGSRSYNLAIAEERMDSVFEILRSLGVAKSRIRRMSAGRPKAASACRSPACRQQIRRVEIVFGEAPRKR